MKWFGVSANKQKTHESLIDISSPIPNWVPVTEYHTYTYIFLIIYMQLPISTVHQCMLSVNVLKVCNH